MYGQYSGHLGENVWPAVDSLVRMNGQWTAWCEIMDNRGQPGEIV